MRLEGVCEMSECERERRVTKEGGGEREREGGREDEEAMWHLEVEDMLPQALSVKLLDLTPATHARASRV